MRLVLLSWTATGAVNVMSDNRNKDDRAVWFDIPVASLDRASVFYAKVLNITVTKKKFDNFTFCMLGHGQGNGGSLLLQPEQITSKTGILVYMNVNGRIRHAVSQTIEWGGEVIEDIHQIDPHGFRAVILDSEGNRLALHSQTDA